MDVMQFPRMVVSSRDGWDLSRERPPMDWLFPSPGPADVAAAAADDPAGIGGVGAQVFPTRFRQLVDRGVLFFVAEHFSVPIMANSIRQASMLMGRQQPARGYLTVAAIAPVPLWLSRSRWCSAARGSWCSSALVALGASAMLIRHGVDRLLGIDEDVEASGWHAGDQLRRADLAGAAGGRGGGVAAARALRP